MDNLEELRREMNNISNLLKHVFDMDFKFLNKEALDEMAPQDTFKNDRVVFEDLDGNPLKLHQLINLNLDLEDPKNNMSDLPQHKSIFNFRYMKPWKSKLYWKYFLESVIHDKIYKSSFQNNVCLLGDKFEIRGIAKSSLENNIKVLRINRHSKCILRTSNKLKVSELVNDPRFKDSFQSVEATYLFPSGQFSVKWTHCFNVFDWPDLSAECRIQIKLRPDTMQSAISSVKFEFQQLKILVDAVENDLLSWSVVGSGDGGMTVEQFKLKLFNLLNNIDTVTIDESKTPLQAQVNKRETDITEDLWCLLKDVANKSTYRACINAMLPILHENLSRVKLNPSNKTEFYRMLSERYLKAEMKIASFMSGLELLFEVGLHKIAKDLIFVIVDGLPDLTQEEISDMFTKSCVVDNLAKGIRNLNSLYNCVLLLEVLRDLFNPSDYRMIGITYVRELICVLEKDTEFNLEPIITTKMKSINNKLRSLSSVWILHFVSTSPFPNEKAVILEIENNEDGFDVYRHDMDLADVVMSG